MFSNIIYFLGESKPGRSRKLFGRSTQSSRELWNMHMVLSFPLGNPFPPRKNGLIAAPPPQKKNNYNNGKKVFLRLNILTCEIIAIPVWKPCLDMWVFVVLLLSLCIYLSFKYSKCILCLAERLWLICNIIINIRESSLSTE